MLRLYLRFYLTPGGQSHLLCHRRAYLVARLRNVRTMVSRPTHPAT